MTHTRARYRYGHVAGSALCTAGLAMLVLTDGSGSTGGANPLLGDVLVISGACVYAVCNIAQVWNAQQGLCEATAAGDGAGLAGARGPWTGVVWGGGRWVTGRSPRVLWLIVPRIWRLA